MYPKSADIVCKIAGINPSIDYHCNPGQIEPHYYVKSIFLAQLARDKEAGAELGTAQPQLVLSYCLFILP